MIENNSEGSPGSRADFIERASKRLIIGTPTATFEGTFHYPIAVRLSDAIRSAFTSDHHFLLTDVVITGEPSLAEPASRAAFVCVNGAHVNVVIPVEEPAATQAGDAPDPAARSLNGFAA
ncbi:MAG: hypothetical protein M3P30_03180 [Chloroflexota bacterium]|nr:hypothetical protein [Chloroflexota bacterium]